MNFICNKCAKKYPLNTFDYKCNCGGLFDLEREKGETIETSISLGEVKTPIIEVEINGIKLHLKLDYFSPTASFKDRGAYILVNAIKNMGIGEVVEDSSGNAAAAIAAYCAAAGIKCNIYVPEGTSAGKIKQIEAYGASIVKVKGNRDCTADAVLVAAKHTYYASHVYNPLFFEGTKSIAYEICEDFNDIDTIFVPVGNGTMLLGLYKGFKEIHSGKMPKIIAVQSKNCCPIYNKFHALADGNNFSETIAEGIAVGTPARIDEIISAVRKSGGDIILVGDGEVVKTHKMLSAKGIYTEQTSAITVAGALEYIKVNGIKKIGQFVVPLTGSGLKK